MKSLFCKKKKKQTVHVHRNKNTQTTKEQGSVLQCSHWPLYCSSIQCLAYDVMQSKASNVKWCSILKQVLPQAQSRLTVSLVVGFAVGNQ